MRDLTAEGRVLAATVAFPAALQTGQPSQRCSSDVVMINHCDQEAVSGSFCVPSEVAPSASKMRRARAYDLGFRHGVACVTTGAPGLSLNYLTDETSAANESYDFQKYCSWNTERVCKRLRIRSTSPTTATTSDFELLESDAKCAKQVAMSTEVHSPRRFENSAYPISETDLAMDTNNVEEYSSTKASVIDQPQSLVPSGGLEDKVEMEINTSLLQDVPTGSVTNVHFPTLSYSSLADVLVLSTVSNKHMLHLLPLIEEYWALLDLEAQRFGFPLEIIGESTSLTAFRPMSPLGEAQITIELQRSCMWLWLSELLLDFDDLKKAEELGRSMTSSRKC
jgi:hypothetical protein